MDITIAAEPPAIASTQPSTERPPLWNPRAATWWGVLLSPAFSAYIHMRNWEALGQDDKVAETRTWFYMMLGCVILCFVLSAVSHIAQQDVTPPASIPFALMLVWHIWGGRAQERYIAALMGVAYTRRPWSKAVWSCIGLLLVGFLASVVLPTDFTG